MRHGIIFAYRRDGNPSGNGLLSWALTQDAAERGDVRTRQCRWVRGRRGWRKRRGGRTRRSSTALRRARDRQDESTANVFFCYLAAIRRRSLRHPIRTLDAHRMTGVAHYSLHPTANSSTRRHVAFVCRSWLFTTRSVRDGDDGFFGLMLSCDA